MKQQTSVGIVKISTATSKELEIYNASQNLVKIKDYATDKELKYVNALMKRWEILLGIEKAGSFELNIIANHIRDNHPTFNALDIEEAINLCVAGKLDTDAEHYGTLSAFYVSKIFKAYQIHKGQVLFKVREELAKIEREKIVVPSEEERIKSFTDLLRLAKDTVSRKELFYDFGDVLYYFFWKNNLVTKPMPKEFEEKALSYGRKTFKIKAQNMALKDVINGVDFNNNMRQKHINEHARTYAVNEWLKEADVDDIIKNITFDMINKFQPKK